MSGNVGGGTILFRVLSCCTVHHPRRVDDDQIGFDIIGCVVVQGKVVC